jgi:hypothetical protein
VRYHTDHETSDLADSDPEYQGLIKAIDITVAKSKASLVF